MANDSGFIANPGCFDIGFVLPFTQIKEHEPDTKLSQTGYESKIFEMFVGTLYPRKLESDKTSRVNSFRKEFERTCSIVWFSNILPSILTIKIGQKITK